jgi:hypothetical protein
VTKTVQHGQTVRRLSHVVAERALPLWAAAAFDEDAQGLYERLTLSGESMKRVLRRLMVQPRLVYAPASLNRWNEGAGDRCWSLSRTLAAGIERRRTVRDGCFPGCRMAGRPTACETSYAYFPNSNLNGDVCGPRRSASAWVGLPLTRWIAAPTASAAWSEASCTRSAAS